MEDIYNNLLQIDPPSVLMIRYVNFLSKIDFKPKVIYDIGSSNGMWAEFAKEAFPDARIMLFDVENYGDKTKFKDIYDICLTDEDGKEVKFYQIPTMRKINSYYKPKYHDGVSYVEKTGVTLSTFIDMYGLPEPDLIKINTCGSEMDIIKGSEELIKNAKYLIVNLQNDEAFENAPKAPVSGPYIQSLGFEIKDILDCNGTPLIDYVFENKNL